MCRAWYRPGPSTATIQQTCGKACRLLRRAQQQKDERKANLAGVRVLDRARKKKQRALGVAGKGAEPPMSRAGLGAQSLAAIERIVDKLGQEQRMSRAGLRRRLTHVALEEIARAVVAPGT